MECPHCGDPVTWLDPPFFLQGRCVTCGEVSNFSVEPRLPRVRLVVRWQGGRPSSRELAAFGSCSRMSAINRCRTWPESPTPRPVSSSLSSRRNSPKRRGRPPSGLGLVVESQHGSVAPLAMFGPLWYQTFTPAEAARSERLVHVWERMPA